MYVCRYTYVVLVIKAKRKMLLLKKKKKNEKNTMYTNRRPMCIPIFHAVALQAALRCYYYYYYSFQWIEKKKKVEKPFEDSVTF